MARRQRPRSLGQTVLTPDIPSRAGADRAAAGRAGRRADARRRGAAAAEWARRAGAGSSGQQEGRSVKRATISADGETITVHIPLTFRKRGGRKLVVTPDGAAWAPRPRVETRWSRRWRGRSGGGRCWTRRARDARGLGSGQGRREDLHEPGLRLTLLAPEIVEAILDGRQAADLHLDCMLNGFPFEGERPRRGPMGSCGWTPGVRGTRSFAPC